MYDMSLDSDGFITEDELRAMNCVVDHSSWHATTKASKFTPLYEAKLVDIYNHRASTFEGVPKENMFGTKPKTIAATEGQLTDWNWHPKPRYWVDQGDTESRIPSWWPHKWLIGFRNALSSVRDSRSLRVTIIPQVGAGNSMPLLYAKASTAEIFCLVANLNALVLDYAVKQKVSGANMNFYIMRQLPVLAPDMYQSNDIKFIANRVAALSFNSSLLMGKMCEELGTQLRSASDREARALLRAELDAFYAHLYGLNRDELRYILDPADVMGPDYPSETFRVLKNNEMRQFGEYRTQRLVLEAWDRMFGK